MYILFSKSCQFLAKIKLINHSDSKGGKAWGRYNFCFKKKLYFMKKKCPKPTSREISVYIVILACLSHVGKKTDFIVKNIN